MAVMVESPTPVPEIKVSDVADDQAAATDSGDLPVPPEIPSLPQVTTPTIPTKLSDFSPEMQASITAYIQKHYPSAKSTAEIEAVLEILVKAVATYYTGDAKIVLLLGKLIGNSNAARHIGTLAWKVLPKSKKHQIYGAMAKYYKEAGQLARSLETSEQKMLDEYSVLFSQPQLSAVQVNIQAWHQIVLACEQYEQSANTA